MGTPPVYSENSENSEERRFVSSGDYESRDRLLDACLLFYY